MNAILHNYGTGWVGVSLALKSEEIDELCRRLRQLQNGEVGHFHLRCDDLEGQEGLADVSISTQGPDELDNMVVE